jgi:argininosuccinate lyase
VKIWDKGYGLDGEVEAFTVGDDHIVDKRLVVYDCIASKAHARMLNKIGVLKEGELSALNEGIDEIAALAEKGEFEIRLEDEDCHSAIERYLTEKCGEAGEKIHTGRSRNDQVLAALRLFEKDALGEMKEGMKALCASLDAVVEKYGSIGIPGYTHMQKAMPSSIGMWATSFVDALADRMNMVDAVHALVDQSPLGTAAGYGVPGLELDRRLTAKLMGFSKVQDNPMYAQFSRGAFEGEILNACSQIMLILNRIASDLIMYCMAEFGFIKLPKEFCTGSSIMPQKLNPDVLELVRARYHDVMSEEFKIKSMLANLISGYNRDVQLTKGALIYAVDVTLASLSIVAKLMASLKIDSEACRRAMTDELHAVERANELVKDGTPFRQAYRRIAKEYNK